MTFAQVIEIVKEHKKPYLILDLIRSPFDVRRLGVFDCEGCPDNISDEEKLSRAIAWLQKMVSLVDDDTQLALTLKPNPKAGKDSWIGPIEFIKSGSTEKKTTGLAGVDFSVIQQLGFVPAAEIQKKELEYLLRLKDREIEELKRRCEEEKQLIKEQALSWGPEKWEGLVDKAVMAYGMLTGKAPVQLQGMPGQQGKLTAEQSLITVINDKLQSFTVKELKAVLSFIEKLKQYERSTDKENKPDESADA